MRLIDADALIRTVRFLTLRDGKEIEIHYVEAERIDSAPTIDAVPVEFIDAQLAEYKGAMSLDKSEREFVFAATAAGTLQRLKHKWAERKEE